MSVNYGDMMYSLRTEKKDQGFLKIGENNWARNRALSNMKTQENKTAVTKIKLYESQPDLFGNMN